MASNNSRMFDRRTSRMVEHVAQVHDHNKAQRVAGLTQPGSEQETFNPSNRSGTPDKGKGLFMGMKPNPVRDVPSRATTVPREYYYSMP